MSQQSRRKYLKRIGISVGIIVAIILGLHLWFSYNAAHFLEQIVHTKSEGKLKLKVKRFTFNYLTNYIEIKRSTLISTDSIQQPTTYNLNVGRLSLKVESFLPLLFKRQLIIDSIKLYDPHITVYRWRPDTANKKQDLSVTREMGKIYNSMLDGLDAFGLKRIVIHNGRFSLVNKMMPESEPVNITNLFFNLYRTPDNSITAIEEGAPLKEKEEITLHTFNQSIAFPNGRHHLSFKNFRLELLRNRIEMDSCIITAQASDSARSQYTIFFEKLMLVNVDFSAMYNKNLIKADSVYCVSPRFHIKLSSADDTTNQKKGTPPDPEKLLQELTGDLQLAFVGVNDAGIRIDIAGKKSRSIFNSNKDDFEIKGLRINADSSKPVVVQRFDMLVRDYRLFNEDSTTSFSFDSIHFSNNKIALSNFNVLTVPGNNGPRSVRDFKIPYFELVGLNWFQLIFNQTINAQQATLYYPDIYYKAKPKTASQKGKGKGIFNVLQNLDSLMTLKRVGVINGQVNMHLNNNTNLSLQNASIILNSNDLLQSTSTSGLKESLTLLQFSNGTIQFKDITALLRGVNYTGNDLLQVNNITVSNTSNTIKASANKVMLNNLIVDEVANTMVLSGIHWNNANIQLSGMAKKGGANANNGAISIKNISGQNTNIAIDNGQIKLNTFINSLAASNISKEGNNPLVIDDLIMNGNKFSFHNGPMMLAMNGFAVHDNATSTINGLHLQKIEKKDSLMITVPKVTFLPNINSILQNNTHLTLLQLADPQIKMIKWSKDSGATAKKASPILRIDKMEATGPALNIAFYKNDSLTSLKMPQNANNRMAFNNFIMDSSGLAIGNFRFKTNTFLFSKPTGQTYGVDKGSVAIQLSKIKVSGKGGKPDWSGFVDSIELGKPNDFAFGKRGNKFMVELASVGNLQLSSTYFTNISQLLRNNLAIWLRTKNGQYIDSTTTIKWFDSEYDAVKKRLTLDSFIYKPTPPRDTIIARSPFQTDYKTIETGRLELTDFDLEKYSKDSSFTANELIVYNPQINIYRDKRPPFKTGIIKNLPVDIFENLPIKVAINKVLLKKGILSYTELNDKTNAEGTVTINGMDVLIADIKNRNIKDNDSLSLQLDGYLMDSAKISLRIKESYADTLSTFLMTVRMMPTTLGFFNPMLAPLANVKIVSGTIDSLQLSAVGREYLALGEMAMYYHNLKIQLVKDGDENKTTFKTRVLSFLANTFLIRKNNNGKKGMVYFERLRDRSFFNYIVKMTLSGMATNIGVKKNKKYIRKYKKEIKEQQLPPIHNYIPDEDIEN